MIDDTKTKEVTWSSGVWICSKCGNYLESAVKNGPGQETAENLKTYLKTELSKRTSGSKDIRVMVSSCLSVCPRGQQAVVILSDSKNSIRKTALALDPEKDREALLDWLCTTLVQS